MDVEGGSSSWGAVIIDDNGKTCIKPEQQKKNSIKSQSWNAKAKTINTDHPLKNTEVKILGLKKQSAIVYNGKSGIIMGKEEDDDDNGKGRFHIKVFMNDDRNVDGKNCKDLMVKEENFYIPGISD